MFRCGDIVRFREGWYEGKEGRLLFVVKEIRLNPVTNEETRCLIEAINYEQLFGANPFGYGEVVDFRMIEKCTNYNVAAMA